MGIPFSTPKMTAILHLLGCLESYMNRGRLANIFGIARAARCTSLPKTRKYLVSLSLLARTEFQRLIRGVGINGVPEGNV